jgi:hypothetical protein
MKKENTDDVSEIAVKPIKNKWFYNIKNFIKILYYKLITKQ